MTTFAFIALGAYVVTGACFGLLFAVCCFWFLTWWAYPFVYVTHFVIDRLGLARRYMRLSGQESFATGALSPWSIVVVDQTFHLIVLLACGVWLSS